jgi:saccharopine dehydrogenase (NADP+, L-glutamate forming)
LRHSSFCKGWHLLVELGLTDPADWAFITNLTTYQEWIDAKLKTIDEAENWVSFKSKLEKPLLDQMNMLELDSTLPLPAGIRSSADILQKILEKKWALQPDDKDMIVMQHEIEYLNKEHQHKKITSSLIVKGMNQERTAMAKTVGLPLGIAAKLILNGVIKTKGLKIPIEKEIYEPVLKELQQNGIEFHENVA